MSNWKLGIAFAFIYVLLMALAVPVLAQEYEPGVSVGQEAEYSNYVINDEQDMRNWTRIKVTAVSGKEVTITEYTAYINGTDETVEKVYDLEAGTADGVLLAWPGT